MVATGTIVARYLDILMFPAAQPAFIPSLIPLFLGLFVMSLYFGRYQFEELGWNSAVSNAALLITTGVTLHLELGLGPTLTSARSIVATGVIVLGLIILFLNFYHVWPPEIAFHVSSSFTSYSLAYLTIAAVYTGLPLDTATYVAGALTFLTLYVVTTGLKRMAHTHHDRYMY